MLFSDVAVVRTVVAVAVMLAVAFVMRRRSVWTHVLAALACAYLLCEFINTIVEMIVDRISLAPNMMSARIKHSSAFVSALCGSAAFIALAVVLWQGLWPSLPVPAPPAATPPQQPPPALDQKPARRPLIENPQVWAQRILGKRKHQRWRRLLVSAPGQSGQVRG